MTVSTEDLQVAILALYALEAEALESWKEYRRRIVAARQHVVDLQLRQLREYSKAEMVAP